MEMERLVVVWCPELLEEGPRGEEARRFVQVVARTGELCPWVHPIRLGVCALPARGPARFFGGEEMVVSRLGQALDEDACIGVADGLFAAVLAARAELAVTLQRLGVTTLGQFAALPPGHVSDRFGADAAACHRVARGESGELAGLRDRAITRRLRVARGEDPDLGADPPPYQPGFFGGTSAADARAARSFARVQERLGIDAVLVGRVQGGRDPSEQATLVPWGSAVMGVAALVSAPWPGRLPPPAPTQVLGRRGRAELVDSEGRTVGVSGRGMLDGEPDRVSIDGGPWQRLTGWAGPWPVTERWWSGRRRRARLQVVTVDGVARLLCSERGQWWVEALYD
jgi:hypothetical protein